MRIRHSTARRLNCDDGCALRTGARMTSDRRHLLEQIGEAAIVQLYADGFASLPLRDKRLACPLCLAALAGRDIYYDQRYAHNLDMRQVLESLITHAHSIEPRVL